MLSKLHDRLGTAGFAVAIVALIAALTGTAIAALPGLNGKQKKAVKKIAKQFAGKPGKPGAPGAPGAVGAVGPVGPAGPKGDPGAPGADGEDGAQGPAGANGKSVILGTATEGPTGECPAGGITVQVEGTPSTKKPVCNGEDGKLGDELAPGQTLSGQWGSFGEGNHSIPFSFLVPLPSKPTPVYIEQLDGTPAEKAAQEAAAASEGCPYPGSGLPNPGPGKLCVWATSSESIAGPVFVFDCSTSAGCEGGAAGRTGFLLGYGTTNPNSVGGVWAVEAAAPTP